MCNGFEMAGKRWISLGLRDLFFLMTIIAIVVSWQLDRRKLILKYNPTVYATANWHVDQVLGKPDTPAQGDIPSAWASKTQDSQKEWLLLKYRWFVRPSMIEIHETYNPGAITKVTMFDWRGKEHVVWEGHANVTARTSPNLNVISVKNSFHTRKIKLYIDSPAVTGWNEIDAVGLVDENGQAFWATAASASSCYADLYQSSANTNLATSTSRRGLTTSLGPDPFGK